MFAACLVAIALTPVLRRRAAGTVHALRPRAVLRRPVRRRRCPAALGVRDHHRLQRIFGFPIHVDDPGHRLRAARARPGDGGAAGQHRGPRSVHRRDRRRRRGAARRLRTRCSCGGRPRTWRSSGASGRSRSLVAGPVLLVPRRGGGACSRSGLAGACFSAMQGTLSYLNALPEYRSRVLGVLTLCIGTGPIGFLHVGWLAETFGASGRADRHRVGRIARAGGAAAGRAEVRCGRFGRVARVERRSAGIGTDIRRSALCLDGAGSFLAEALRTEIEDPAVRRSDPRSAIRYFHQSWAARLVGLRCANPTYNPAVVRPA